MEIGSYPTTFVNGTRSTSQAILDLTGKTTITAQSLTYGTTENSFTFNGTSDKIYQTSIPTLYNSVSNALGRSWEVVVKKTGTMTTAAIFGHKVSAGCSYFCDGGIYIWGGTWNFNWYDNAAYQWLNSTVTATQNQYFHIVGTFDPTDLKNRIYINGELKATSAATNMNYGSAIGEYSVAYNSKNDFGGGGATDYFQGEVPIVKYYSGKTLSSDEVRQNFNALRGRYGL
jgi:hypothetical protein